MASYEHAVKWIADNDEPTEMDLDAVSWFISTLLVADLWNKEPEQVGMDIIKERINARANHD